MPWWLEGGGEKTTENKIHWPCCPKLLGVGVCVMCKSVLKLDFTAHGLMESLSEFGPCEQYQQPLTMV